MSSSTRATCATFVDALFDAWRADLVDDRSLAYLKRTCSIHDMLLSDDDRCETCERLETMKASTSMQKQKLPTKDITAETDAMLRRQGENAQRAMLSMLGPIELRKRYRDALDRFGSEPREHQRNVLRMYEELIGLR